MADRQYLLDIDCPSGLTDLFSAPLAAVHAANANEGSTIGIGFPFWRYDPKSHDGALGMRMRLVAGSPDRLLAIMMSPALESLFDGGALVCGDVVPAPSDAPRARFRRYRAYERAQRAYARGAGDWRDDVSAYPGLLVTSGSNGHRFRIRIERIDSDSPPLLGYNRYGLAADGRPGNIPVHGSQP